MRVRSTRCTGVRYQRSDTLGGEQGTGHSPEIHHSKLMPSLVYNSTLARCNKNSVSDSSHESSRYWIQCTTVPDITPRSRNAITLKVKAGTLVLLHHSLVHYSNANSSEKSRHAYSIHVVEGEEGYRYPSDNWLQRPKDAPFQKLPWWIRPRSGALRQRRTRWWHTLNVLICVRCEKTRMCVWALNSGL